MCMLNVYAQRICSTCMLNVRLNLADEWLCMHLLTHVRLNVRLNIRLNVYALAHPH